MTTYLISDLHLDETRPQITAAFFDFLRNRAAGAKALYILGDFFEVWIGDDDDAPLANQVAQALREYSSTGVEVYLMHGNRDFLLGHDFAQRAGATLLPDPSCVTFNGQKVLLMHGDTLCTRDIEYQAFRQQARDPNWQKNLLAKPLEERRAIAAQIRAVSKTMNSRKAEDIMDVTEDEVERVMREHGVQLLIHGHTHRPARHPLSVKGEPGERIVLGDWGEHGWCVKVSEHHLELMHWPIG
ncbi:UDP-2,3-diacylglucosamine diphosphatase [Microbulbifer thermotolerans]|uniref:UDP-2,3-diacylglucosamine hydrolase n=1 Tax=Microbulbifer thermotolerans TaxID=252514 RepID=A0A143HLW0_MICTH|nr:UDP-2,3-diacylglucosamine diphosphatase [Microbulbifer thermotolerans]AMX02689.1 UDP-2,3-diacylglucosamine diphosphatase [Microbulbifer thermotolerans]MCX2780376.1 UDP-2,3-diacylglucosamine diphosphatase [Microbulbifer thermotolerans]MCX2782502.1 UDP-2,3-diacylglucosamine diphosphatase [Microbulbifer thermotolerans]MCX2794514.1 UDP-2,3-diacylglucosamine diphosphatase [Microbulbifer thermotolerans]MCX2802209.1 UDP-2,3-diacylglucosamine diphosphatase [Microbulbifer thermotolerans]